MTARVNSRSQDGFTLIEVVIAAFLSIIVVLAIGSTLGKGALNSLGHQRQAATLTIAQREIERIHQIVAQWGFDAVALSGQPGAPTAGTPQTNPSNPNDHITNHGLSNAAYRIYENFHNTTLGVASGTPAAGEGLVIGGTATYPTTGRVDPLTTGVTSGTVTATVYRYVTSRVEACTTANACDGDSRRVVIAVVPTNNPTTELQTSKPFYLTTVINNPVPQDEPGTTAAGLRIGVNIG
ncbi:MAG: hypothetical protein QOJ89_4237 [bacterium]|jgi:Tfp pilus assembly protein PilV